MACKVGVANSLLVNWKANYPLSAYCAELTKIL